MNNVIFISRVREGSEGKARGGGQKREKTDRRLNIWTTLLL